MIFRTQFLVVKSPVSISGLRLTIVMRKVTKAILSSLDTYLTFLFSSAPILASERRNRSESGYK